MPDYDFNSLSPIDFEVLVRDLLQKELSLTLESFKTGKDKGIDLRHCSDLKNILIIQCKHYAKSGFQALLNILRTEELDKIKKLDPKRYIIATSVPLNPEQKDKIIKSISPYIWDTSDIYGKDDLNNLLGKFPDIERKTIKLWLSSSVVLDEILHSGIYNISRSEIERIMNHAFIYVQNESFEEAIKILEKHNFCIIAGIPGIGKTMLAEMISLHYCKADYELIKVSNDIEDAWKLAESSNNRIFYYDDFLGQTSLSEKLNKNEDQRLIDFIHTVRKSKKSKMILTTREYILQQAYQKYEKLERENFKAEKCIVDLEKYTRLNKAKILFNHIYFSSLPEEYREQLLMNRNYLSIIDHANYSPRIIELFTDVRRLSDLPPAQYVDKFHENLNNPFSIWEHAFNDHLSQSARNLLLLFVTMPYRCFKKDLENVFSSYQKAYSKCFGFQIKPHDFHKALKELDGDFFKYEKDEDNIIVEYLNPSVRDFIKHHLMTSPQELELIIQNIKYFDQLKSLWSWNEKNGGRDAIVKLFENNSAWAKKYLIKMSNYTSCGIINIHYTDSDTYKTEYRHISFESKIALIINIGYVCCPDIMNFIQKALKAIITNISKNNFDSNGLAAIIEAIYLQISDKIDWALEFFEESWDAMLEDSNFANELYPLHKLITKCPDIISEKKMNEMKDSIRSIAENILGWDHDPDNLRDEADTLESLAEDIGIDIANEIRKINQLADEKESEEDDEVKKPDYHKNQAKYGNFVGDEEIASLFSMLEDI